MCWEPSQEAMSPSQVQQQPASTQVSGASGAPFVPTPVPFHILVSECPFPTWYTKKVWATTPEEFSALSGEAYLRQLRQPWSWPVCHYARWIYRNHGYHVVVRRKRPHHPVHWVKVGKNTGFVPAHPSDQKDKPPVNLKHGIFTVSSTGDGEHLERIAYKATEKVQTLTAAPKEFRAGSFPQLAKAEPPTIEARLVLDAALNARSSDTKRNESKITYDYGKGTFVRGGAEVAGSTSKPVVVGSLNSRGSFSGSGGSGSSGRGGEGGSRGGGAAGGSGRESAAGRSSGGYGASGGDSGSRGDGGSSSGGTSSAASSSGGGSRPR
jgi:hypothetical protein